MLGWIPQTWGGVSSPKWGGVSFRFSQQKEKNACKTGIPVADDLPGASDLRNAMIQSVVQSEKRVSRQEESLGRSQQGLGSLGFGISPVSLREPSIASNV